MQAKTGKVDTLAALYEPRRRNAVGFLRYFLAACVVFSHSFRLGGFGQEPLRESTGETLGTLAVQCFFVLSGFLIARSFATCDSVWRFLWHRVLRIFPGYWVCLAMTALVLGPLVSRGEAAAFEWATYLRATPTPLGYLTRNFLLRTNQPGIGGLLRTTPFPTYLNGALWSLEHEFKCYVGVAVVGVFGLFARRQQLGRAVLIALLVTLLALVNVPSLVADAKLDGNNVLTIRLAVWFCAGAAAYTFADRIPVRGWLFALAAVATVGAYCTRHQHLVGPITLSYSLFFLGLRLPLTWWDKHGDLSYGLYIYAFPIQQLLAVSVGRRIGLAGSFGVALVLASLVALLSWRVVERPALRMKKWGQRTAAVG